MATVERKCLPTINQITKQGNLSGFKFSTSKAAVTYSGMEETQILNLTSDCKLAWIYCMSSSSCRSYRGGMWSIRNPKELFQDVLQQNSSMNAVQPPSVDLSSPLRSYVCQNNGADAYSESCTSLMHPIVPTAPSQQVCPKQD
ncbi:uncharacterized protein [Macrobrachium rosenbergii]|uniref:uncharacterized protein n=1 Tax=Macrobrachium rosenbergii TaxID=79674 RepID=UPI0034D597CD